MPLYTYECEKCGTEFDCMYSHKDFPRSIPCDTCDGTARKVIVNGHGGVLRDEPVWLDRSVHDALCDESEPPITTRGEWKKVMKEKNVVAIG